MTTPGWKGKVLHYPAVPGHAAFLVVQIVHVDPDGSSHLVMQFPGVLVETLRVILASVAEHHPGLVGETPTVTSVEKVEVPAHGDPKLN